MSKKKKLATLVVSGMVLLALLAGGLTYALFTDNVSNEANTFQAGTLTLESHRHDVPIEGPMFYRSNTDNGWMGTGRWVPRDTHTRAMFIKNTGTLQGKLTELSAEVQSGDHADFAEQALVTIAFFEAPPGTDLAPAVMKEVNDAMDAAYKAGMSFWLTRPVTRTVAQLNADVRKAFLDNLNNISALPLISKVEVYSSTLEELVNGATPGNDITVDPGQTLYMGYTVHLRSDRDFAGEGFDSDDAQGKNVTFKFNSLFTQTANN